MVTEDAGPELATAVRPGAEAQAAADSLCHHIQDSLPFVPSLRLALAAIVIGPGGRDQGESGAVVGRNQIRPGGVGTDS